ncbi:three-Cys-motif partner protein TcmP [Acinetobacter defluvii]|uniref:three-Cys-motif partner protein TcmP n=1 Tax=Acinetobacter defluvii TaxID=1871111 RepID=UPI003AF6B3B6
MVKKNDKYTWNDDHIPDIDPHSIIKHKILREYISAYIPILLSNPNMPKLTINLIDGFCGGGVYRDGNHRTLDGSPIHLIETINESRVFININREKPRQIDAHYFFLDKDKNTLQKLKNIISAKYKDNLHYQEDYNKINYFNTEFSKSLPSIINSIKQNKGGERSIFFLDQYGYGDVKINDIKNIISSLKNSEIILTFNIDSMFPYFSKDNHFRQALINLGIDSYIDWSILEKLPKSGYDFRRFIQKNIAKAIKELSTAKFMTLFFVKPQSNKEWGYWLVHLSNAYRAHDVMKKLHWNNATYFAHTLEPGIFEFGYEASKDTALAGNTQTFDFDDLSRQASINALHVDFGKIVFDQNKNIPVGHLFPSVVTNTPASEEILQASLKQLHEEKSVEILNADGKPRKPSKIYHKDDIIIPSRQYLLF